MESSKIAFLRCGSSWTKVGQRSVPKTGSKGIGDAPHPANVALAVHYFCLHLHMLAPSLQYLYFLCICARLVRLAVPASSDRTDAVLVELISLV